MQVLFVGWATKLHDAAARGFLFRVLAVCVASLCKVMLPWVGSYRSCRLRPGVGRERIGDVTDPKRKNPMTGHAGRTFGGRFVVGLRGRLVVGLALVVLVLVASVGLVALWAIEQQLVAEQAKEAAVLADSAAGLTGAAVRQTPRGLGHPNVQRFLKEAFGRLVAQPGSVEISVIDERARTIEVGDGRGVPALGADPVVRLVRGGGGRLVERHRSAGQHRGKGADFLVYRLVPGTGLVLRLVYDRDRAVHILMHKARRSVLILAIVDALLVIVLAALFLTRSVTGPLKRLEAAARRVAAGDLEQDVFAEGEAEIRALSQAFSVMTSRLRDNRRIMQDQIERLSHQAAELEAKQKELDASYQRLVQTEKFASVGRLAAGIAHEVGNPLTALQGYVEMLRGGDLDAKTEADFLQRMNQELKRMDAIIRGLLDYARREKETVQPVVVRKAVLHAGELVKVQRRFAGVDIVVRVTDDLRAAASPNRLVQVLVNLFLNAADAMEGHGTIVVEEESVEDGEAASAETIRLLVRDTGPGIAPEIRDQVFDPFFTTKDVGQGTGLGLSVSLALVEAMGGHLEFVDQGPLEVENSEQGTVFRMVLRRWDGN